MKIQMNFKIVQFRVIAFGVCVCMLYSNNNGTNECFQMIIKTRCDYSHEMNTLAYTNEKWATGQRNIRRIAKATATANVDKRKRYEVKKFVSK